MAPRFLAWAVRWMAVLPTEFEIMREAGLEQGVVRSILNILSLRCLMGV